MALQKLSCVILKGIMLFTYLQHLANINQDFQALHLGLKDLRSAIQPLAKSFFGDLILCNTEAK